MTWVTQRRETGLIEHRCEHGIGHPNFYSGIRLNGYSDKDNAWGVHGCDLCCQRSDFPGHRVSNHERIGMAHRQYQSGELEVDLAFEYAFHDIYINDLLAGLVKIPKPIMIDPTAGRRHYARAWLDKFHYEEPDEEDDSHTPAEVEERGASSHSTHL